MPRSSYPWAEWMQHDEGILVRGIHFNCKPSTFATMIKEAASRQRHLIADTQVRGDIVAYTLRAPKEIEAQAIWDRPRDV